MTFRLPMAVAACGVLGLSACTDPAQLNPDTNYTRDNAIVGGALGTVAGLAATGGRAKGALAGAAIGAGAGALIGNQMDKQAAALRQSIGDNRIIINQQGDVLVVTLPQDILFDVDSTAVRADLQDELRALALNLNEFPDTTAQVVGHTDNTGDATYNQDLSVRRAQTVSNIIAANGVAPTRLTALGRGEDAPVASNLSEEGRAQNRRVDILIRPAST
ncbi:outer membrane protein OmpA-like peptidoglycan-associated protein [Aliiruegeria haliotis]|uniref:Outer membrane protein OmpA-like peptidoglycan-associated protein n=1 Tax=Aliiruegeria haliotis TaxID=1280846 RepID=A0A2T0RRF3_9RHOB|nr:OmpA family protein [Aliiruegeria haliotis]PRY23785.1 outer membrane protein OmpA-like peptidoglycan-associated protein [Aliiruegeria haliotis]